jgi:hypothetical protein
MGTRSQGRMKSNPQVQACYQKIELVAHQFGQVFQTLFSNGFRIE